MHTTRPHQTTLARIAAAVATMCLATLLAATSAGATTGLQCPDEDLLLDVEVLVDGVWQAAPLPDGAISTTSTGPFDVRARVAPAATFADVVLHHGLFEEPVWSSSPMVPGTGDTIVGQIPEVGGPGTVGFYLTGVDETGAEVYVQEIRYGCDPATGGDPFGFVIDAPIDTIEGSVTFRGAPVAGVEVFLWADGPHHTCTDDEGRYRFDVPAGTAGFTATGPTVALLDECENARFFGTTARGRQVPLVATFGDASDGGEDFEVRALPARDRRLRHLGAAAIQACYEGFGPESVQPLLDRYDLRLARIEHRLRPGQLERYTTYRDTFPTEVCEVLAG